METIKSAKEILEILRALGETNRIEAKTGGSVARSIMETVCAFANEPGLGGDTILLGVNEQKELLIPNYPVVGVPDVDKITNDLLSQCRSIFNIPVTPRIEPEDIEGKIVLVVSVPESAAGSQPVYFKSDGLPHGAFRRGSSGDVQCSEDDLLILYTDRSAESFDSSVVPHAEWDDIDPDAVEDYRRERRAFAPAAAELLYSDEELLYSLSCVQKLEWHLSAHRRGDFAFWKKVSVAAIVSDDARGLHSRARKRVGARPCQPFRYA